MNDWIALATSEGTIGRRFFCAMQAGLAAEKGEKCPFDDAGLRERWLFGHSLRRPSPVTSPRTSGSHASHSHEAAMRKEQNG